MYVCLQLGAFFPTSLTSLNSHPTVNNNQCFLALLALENVCSNQTDNPNYYLIAFFNLFVDVFAVTERGVSQGCGSSELLFQCVWYFIPKAGVGKEQRLSCLGVGQSCIGGASGVSERGLALGRKAAGKPGLCSWLQGAPES